MKETAEKLNIDRSAASRHLKKIECTLKFDMRVQYLLIGAHLISKYSFDFDRRSVMKNGSCATMFNANAFGN